MTPALTSVPRATNQWGRGASLLLVMAIVAAGLLLGAPAASAEWSCKEPPTPERPGAGLVGSVDLPTVNKGENGSVYEDFSYAGQRWWTYDTGCMGDPNAAVDTTLGNWAFNGAKLLVSVTNAAHWFQRDDGALEPMDDLVSVLTVELYNNAFLPWVGLALLIAGIGAFWHTLKGNLANVGKGTMWLLAGLTFASATYLTPLTYTTIADELLTDGVTELQDKLLAGSDMDARKALPTILHEQVVYRNWLKGEFGDSDSAEATRFGRQLLDAQACSKIETLNEQTGDTPCPVEEKKAQFEQIGDELADTTAYGTFTGVTGNRTGVGFGALIESLSYTSFQAMALLALALAKLILRIVVLTGPIIGLVAIVHNAMLPKVFHAIGTAIGHGAVLALASIVHLRVIAWILDPAQRDVLGFFGQLLLASVVTLVLWMALKPGRKVRNMLEASMKLGGVQTMPWEQIMQRRMMRRMRRGQRRHERDESRAHEAINNNLYVMAHGDRPEQGAAPGPTYAQSQRVRVPSERMPPERDAFAAAPAGSLAGGSGGTDRSGGSESGAPGGRPGPAPGGAPGGTGAPGPDQAWTGEGGHRTALPGSPSSEVHEPQQREPDVILPSEHQRSEVTTDASWLGAEQEQGPSDAAPSRRDGDRHVWNVYRPSSGQVEEFSDPSASRPESQE